MKHFRALLFVLLIMAMIVGMDYAFVPSGYIRYIMHQSNNSETEEGYDTIILGASHARSAIDPMVLDNMGASRDAFNFAIPGETVNDAYYLLMECDRNNNIKTVIYDLDYQYWCNYPEREFEDCFIYTWLPFSRVKLKYIADNLVNKDFRTTYSKRWAYELSPEVVKNNLSVKRTKAYRDYSIDAVEIHDAGGPYSGKGFFYRDYKMDGLVESELIPWDENGISKKVLDSFARTVKYCKDKGIELICITSPITPTTAVSGDSENAGEFFAGLCADYGVRYIDFNLLTMEKLPRNDEDFFDQEGHMLGVLAERYSEVLAETILGKCDKSTSFYESYEHLKNTIYKNTVIKY